MSDAAQGRVPNRPPRRSPDSSNLACNRRGTYIVGTHREAGTKTKLVRIGNSRGVRLAKAFIEEAGLTDEVEIRARAGAVIITAVNAPRAGWAAAAAQYGPEPLLDDPTATRFDDAEWEWR